MELNSGEVTYLHEYVKILNRDKETDQALHYAKKLIVIAPQNASCFETLGNLLFLYFVCVYLCVYAVCDGLVIDFKMCQKKNIFMQKKASAN